MKKLSTLGVTLSILLSISFMARPAAAKRSMPKGVAIVHEGVRYEAVHFGKSTEKKIQAIDIKSGAKLWELVIYKVRVDPKLERDVQEVFINSMKVDGDKLIMTNEYKEEFVVDLTKRKVISRKVRGREAHSCDSDSDCMTTCAQGAINKDWYAKNKKGLGTCKDGCTRKGTKPARCMAGICTRIGRNGKPDPSCTKKLLWYYTP